MLLASLPLLGAQAPWRESSFTDFADGTFSDHGANAYVSAAGRIQTINRWDFNGDGFVDILCANTHPLVEMLDMSIYWGNGKDYSIERHSYVPADGPMWVAAGDLNRDGRVDLAVANYSNGTWTSMDSAIYWGGNQPRGPGPEGQWHAFPFFGKTMLPSENAQGVTIADLNRDGFPEVIFAFSSGFWEYNKGATAQLRSRIYWNRAGVFAPKDVTELDVSGATDVEAADLDGDGWVDLAFSVGEGPTSRILYGAPEGFTKGRQVDLPTAGANAVRLADVNNDGKTDVLFANKDGSASWAYLNSGGRFDAGSRIEFETHFAKDVVVADFNRDGFADVFFSNHMLALPGEERFGNRMTPSYLYFGGPEGFRPERRQSIQTIGAWGAAVADLNNDGWVDLLVCNSQEHYSFEVPSFVYWNGPQGFDVTRRTPLYEHGAQGNAIADFNHDGHLDILITSMMGRSRADYDDVYLYLGNKQGQYSVDRRIVLPSREPYEQAMADLNDDGAVDVVVMNQGETGRIENEAWIYWNKANQLDPWRMTGLPAYAGVGVEVSDLDRDGYLDVIVANGQNFAVKPDARSAGPSSASVQPGSFIYWGSAAGYVTTKRTALNVSKSRSPSIADVNGDGHLDLVFAGPGASIFFGDGTRRYGDERRQFIKGTLGQANHQTEIADLNRDGFLDVIFAGAQVMVYYGGEGAKYDASHRVVLDVDAKTITVADVNGDGWLDLVCPLYKDKGQRSLDSSILLGSADGFNLSRRILLPTDGATGSLVSDFNADGFNDVFFFCHRQDGSPEEVGRYGDHRTNSRLYWGSAEGFARDRYLGIPTVGVHYDMGVDLGTIDNRTFSWEYVSSAHEAGKSRATSLNWEARTPGNTAVRFQLRFAPTRDELANAVWQGPDGPKTYFTKSGSDLRGLSQQSWIQYRLFLDTANGAASPTVSAVQVNFE